LSVVSAIAVRPKQVRKEKPRVSAFISADVPKILALKPDLVLTFSDLQADIVAELIRANVAVHAFNSATSPVFSHDPHTGRAGPARLEKPRRWPILWRRVNAVHEGSINYRTAAGLFRGRDEPMISALAGCRN